MKDLRRNNRKSKKFNTPDIIQSLKRANCKIELPNTKIYNKIIEDYLELMHTTLLHGFEWKLPKDVGTLRIYKSFYKKEALNQAAGRSRKPGVHREGYCYTVSLNSEHLKKNGMNFKPSTILQVKLNKVLNRTNKDYQFRP